LVGTYDTIESTLEAALTDLYSVAEEPKASEPTAKLDAVVEPPTEQEPPTTPGKMPGIGGIEFYKWVEETKCEPQRIRDALDDPSNEFARFKQGEGKVAVFDLDNEARWRLVEILES